MPGSLALIAWPGGECPVDPKAVVYVGFRNGNFITLPVTADSYRWEHAEDSSLSKFDIVCYALDPAAGN